MSDPFVGQITLFAGNFPPKNYAFCDGALIAISQNTALFSILGTTYGGNGTTTFALPDLRGRVPIHVGSGGNGGGLFPVTLGQLGGEADHTLTQAEIPAHTHSQPATGGAETTNRPNGAVPAEGGVYAGGSDGSNLSPTTAAGGSQPHNNMPPYLAINYIIALFGIFPARN